EQDNLERGRRRFGAKNFACGAIFAYLEVGSLQSGDRSVLVVEHAYIDASGSRITCCRPLVRVLLRFGCNGDQGSQPECDKRLDHCGSLVQIEYRQPARKASRTRFLRKLLVQRELSFLDSPWTGCYLFVGALLLEADGGHAGLIVRGSILLSDVDGQHPAH